MSKIRSEVNKMEVKKIKKNKLNKKLSLWKYKHFDKSQVNLTKGKGTYM